MRFCLLLLMLTIYKANYLSQTPTGIYDNKTTSEFNVIDCFKTKNFSNKFTQDSLKSNSIFIGNTIWRTISLENKTNQQLFNATNKCIQVGLFEIIKFGLFEKKLNAFSSDVFNNTKNTHLNEKQLFSIIGYCDSSETTVFDSYGNEKK